MTDLYAILGGIGAIVFALFAAFLGGGRYAKTKAKLDTAKATEKAHERLNNAEHGSNDDDLNIGSLREFAERYGKR